jgi:CheY-like chemotaxis protein
MNENTATVLVVEDNEQLNKLYSKALAHIGLQTVQAGSGRQAIEQLCMLVPDVVLLDMVMKDGDGRDVIKFMKTQPRLSQTEIVIVSGGGKQYEDYARAEGIDYFLQKPVSVGTLIDFVQNLICQPVEAKAG